MYENASMTNLGTGWKMALSVNVKYSNSSCADAGAFTSKPIGNQIKIEYLCLSNKKNEKAGN